MALSGQARRLYGPAYLTNAAANVYNQSSALLYTNIKQLHLVNVTASAATFTLYIGATGGSTGGTEIAKLINIPADAEYNMYFSNLYLASTDFLTGLASASSTITITVLGELVAV